MKDIDQKLIDFTTAELEADTEFAQDIRNVLGSMLEAKVNHGDGYIGILREMAFLHRRVLAGEARRWPHNDWRKFQPGVHIVYCGCGECRKPLRPSEWVEIEGVKFCQTCDAICVRNALRGDDD